MLFFSPTEMVFNLHEIRMVYGLCSDLDQRNGSCGPALGDFGSENPRVPSKETNHTTQQRFFGVVYESHFETMFAMFLMAIDVFTRE